MIFPILAQASNVATQFPPEATQPWPTVDPAVAQAATAEVVAQVAPLQGIPAPVVPESDFGQQILGAISSIVPRGWEQTALDLGLKAVAVLMLLTLAWTISSWASSLMRTALERVRFDETLTIFLSKLVRWSILALAAITCLSKFGGETTSIAAMIGAAGLAIGLAFQGTLSNFSAGAMLLIFRPYKVGDEVNVAGYTGTVREIELFTTAIDTPDNRRIIVPNSSIFGAVIENVTHHTTRRFEVLVGTAYSADIDETRKVLERAVRSAATIVPTPEPAVVLLDLGASSVNWAVRAWATREQHGKAKQDVIRAVKNELDAARIAIPFPQLDLHLNQAAEAACPPPRGLALCAKPSEPGRPRPRPPWSKRCAAPTIGGMDVINLAHAPPFTTKDGSEIRELLAHRNSAIRNQSLAEARLPPGTATAPHYHPRAEEIYFLLEGRGRMQIEGDVREASPGDAIAIPPGQRHQITCISAEPLRFLCCCAPAYEHEDTVMVDDWPV